MIVDEEQDSSYKQEETPRYHARDVAVMRAKMAGAVVVLGSATPSLESYFNAKKNKYALLELPDRVEQRPLPEVEIVDMRQEFQETGKEQVISRKLAEEIRAAWTERSRSWCCSIAADTRRWRLCRACGKRMECRNCAISMTHHKRSNTEWCATTADSWLPCQKYARSVAASMFISSEPDRKSWKSCCTECFRRRASAVLIATRFADSEDFERALNALNEGELDLLVGTQMIAKGHEFMV